MALALPPLPGGCSLRFGQTPIMSGFGVSEVAVVISVCQMSAYAAYGAGFRLWVWPDTHALEMAIPTSVYVSMVNLRKLPVWQSPQDNINFFLELDTSWILRAMHVRGALQLETPVPHMCRKAANLG